MAILDGRALERGDLTAATLTGFKTVDCMENWRESRHE